METTTTIQDNMTVKHRGVSRKTFLMYLLQLPIFGDSLSNSSWTFYINPNISSASIPILPSSVYAEYPELSGAYFKMRSVGVSDYLCVDSYQEWLELYFSTDGYYGDFCPEYRSVGYRVY